MIQNYTPSQRRTIVEYNLVFDDGRHNGFSFPCDANGNLYEDMPEPARINYEWCLKHPEKFVLLNVVCKQSWTIRDHAYGTCHCGNRVALYDEYYGACQCDECGQWYNLSGQEILPPDEWQENFYDDY